MSGWRAQAPRGPKSQSDHAASARALEACRQRAAQAGVRFVTLEPTPSAPDSYVPADPALQKLLPSDLCRELGLLPVALEDGTVLIAAAEPIQYLPYDVAAALGGRPVVFVLAPEDQLARAFGALGSWERRAS